MKLQTFFLTFKIKKNHLKSEEVKTKQIIINLFTNVF